MNLKKKLTARIHHALSITHQLGDDPEKSIDMAMNGLREDLMEKLLLEIKEERKYKNASWKPGYVRSRRCGSNAWVAV